MSEIIVIDSTLLSHRADAYQQLVRATSKGRLAMHEFNEVIRLQRPVRGGWVQQYVAPAKKGKGPRDRWGRL